MSRSSNFRTRLLAVISGVIFALAFPPFGTIGGFGAFVALVPLLIALEDSTRLRDAFWTGYLAMFVWSLGATYWVGGWKGEGAVDPFLMASGVALAIIHPLFLIIPVLVYDTVRRKFGRAAALAGFPIFWIGLEYWHSTGDLSFPWLNLYNTQTYNTAYIQFIEFTGSYGLSLAIVLVNIFLYLALRSRANRRRFVTIAAALIVVPYIFGFIALGNNTTTTPSRSLTITIVQPNINPWDKWSTGTEVVTDSMFRSTRTALSATTLKPDLVLWPETAITYPVTLKWESRELAQLYHFMLSVDAAVLTGIPDREEYFSGADAIPSDAKKTRNPDLFYREWNSSVLFYHDLSGMPSYQKYHKQMLVPFGEHVPFGDELPILGQWFQWGIGLGSWNRGTGYNNFTLPIARSGMTSPDTAKLCSMICYESVYPWYVRKFVANGAEIISIITNDGWYGNSSGPYQHNRFAILRAIENRRWIVRSANTGISSVIDDKGHILDERPVFQAASITRSIPLLDGETLYTKLGDVIAIPCEWALGGMIVFLVGLTIIQRRKNRIA